MQTLKIRLDFLNIKVIGPLRAKEFYFLGMVISIYFDIVLAM